MSAPVPAPWIARQRDALLAQRGHAWLLQGPSGLGQYALALELARAWLCDQPTEQGACGQCGSCHAIEVHAHADLCVLMPETVMIALGWPLDEKAQADIDDKKRKASKEIRVEAMRDAVEFSQRTSARGRGKAVLVYPAERMNNVTANALLKTLEEPPGDVKFVLASEAAHHLLPTIRSRCLGHTMSWPDFAQSLDWLQNEMERSHEGEGGAKKAARPVQPSDLHALLVAAGGRPSDALTWAQSSPAAEAAQHWQALPKAMARGDVSALADWAPAQAVDALQKLCHDVLATRLGAQPRFFSAKDLPAPASGKPGSPASAGSGLYALAAWSKELATTARTVEHPYNPGLMLESLVSRARLALNAK
ncbi:DNA polymerase III subunit delta' [Polaromonas sp.]|uniref:DNA polymerase III subunit delta' n=1 Tax=Polaromonas sp. TaxID=1869339 RepID=UPI002FC75A1F